MCNIIIINYLCAAMSDEEFEDEMGSGISLDHYETLVKLIIIVLL